MKKSFFKIIAFIAVLTMMYSCNMNNNRYQKVDTSSIDIPPVNIDRYERALFSIDTTLFIDKIKDLQTQYPVFLGTEPISSPQKQQLFNYVSDTQLIKLYRKTEKQYPNIKKIEDELTSMMQYYHYYFLNQKDISVYSYISGLDTRNSVIFADSILIIPIDMYLGKDFTPYQQVNLPAYKRRNLQEKYIPVDCAEAIALYYVQDQKGMGKLLKTMIDEGKRLYIKDALLPFYADTLKIKYTSHQLAWCQKNEKQIWTFLIENDLIFSGKYSKYQKLLSDGPFTADFGRDSAPRIAHWVGWQIVRKYMEKKPEITLMDLIHEHDYAKILNLSGYKP